MRITKAALLLTLGVSTLGITLACQSSDGNSAQSTASEAPFTDWRHESPGNTRKITVNDLPKPYATKSVDNGADIVDRPANAWPKVPPGFKVDLYAGGVRNPRLIRTAPNGDLFLADSTAGEIRVLRGVDSNGKARYDEVFASGLRQPFGIAFYPPGPNPQWVYIGDTDEVLRFPYQNGDLKARGAKQHIADLPGGGRLRGGGHWTRDVAFSLDGKKMWVSVGSRSNVDDTDNNEAEYHRADVLEFNPDGSGERVYASGIRNCVGEAVNPTTGELWCSVNERDGLGDNLVPDYITHVQDGGFYGWPWYYIGGHQDPRLADKHPDLRTKMITPDVLIQPHSASLEMTFYEGQQFPAEYLGDIFAAEHGSWNRSVPAGYEVIRVPLHGTGHTDGSYEDFMTGFVTDDGKVWGRPVGVAVGNDGSLFVSDDGSNSVWRVTYTGAKRHGGVRSTQVSLGYRGDVPGSICQEVPGAHPVPLPPSPTYWILKTKDFLRYGAPLERLKDLRAKSSKHGGWQRRRPPTLATRTWGTSLIPAMSLQQGLKEVPSHAEWLTTTLAGLSGGRTWRRQNLQIQNNGCFRALQVVGISSCKP